MKNANYIGVSETEKRVSGDDREGKTMTHYIGMAGLHGSLPQFCSSYDRKEDAVSDLASLHELGKNRTAELKRNLYLELNLKRDGNEYCEITECDCSNPEDHNDN
jgi:hypothetical protein